MAQPVTAADFEYSIKRLLSPELKAGYASFYFNIVGAEDYSNSGGLTPEQRAALRAAVGVKAIDSITLEIKLNNVQPVFPQLMAMWPVYPVRQEYHSPIWIWLDYST